MTATSRRKLVICLDTTLLIIFVLLLSPRMTGLPLHEVLGIIFFVPLIVHLILAWPWIQNSTRKFFRSPRRTQFNFLLNTILFILVIAEIVSGIFISQVVLPYLGKTMLDRSWRSVHNLTLNFTVLFAGLHIAINWVWIASVFKKRLNAPKRENKVFSPKILITLLRTTILISAAGFVALVLYSFLGNPSLKRLYSQDEIARFTPTFGHGIGQLLGETFLIALYAFVSRKWLNVRL